MIFSRLLTYDALFPLFEIPRGLVVPPLIDVS